MERDKTAYNKTLSPQDDRVILSLKLVPQACLVHSYIGGSAGGRGGRRVTGHDQVLMGMCLWIIVMG